VPVSSIQQRGEVRRLREVWNEGEEGEMTWYWIAIAIACAIAGPLVLVIEWRLDRTAKKVKKEVAALLADISEDIHWQRNNR